MNYTINTYNKTSDEILKEAEAIISLDKDNDINILKLNNDIVLNFFNLSTEQFFLYKIEDSTIEIRKKDEPLFIRIYIGSKILVSLHYVLYFNNYDSFSEMEYYIIKNLETTFSQLKINGKSLKDLNVNIVNHKSDIENGEFKFVENEENIYNYTGIYSLNYRSENEIYYNDPLNVFSIITKLLILRDYNHQINDKTIKLIKKLNLFKLNKDRFFENGTYDKTYFSFDLLNNNNNIFHHYNDLKKLGIFDFNNNGFFSDSALELIRINFKY